MEQRWGRQLDAGLAALGLDLAPQARRRLLDYLALLHKWNRAFNLTAVRDPGRMVARHLLDSLTILPWLRGPRLLDLGSGAGLPGIPLAIARPDLQFTLLDANGKKTRFLEQVRLTLELERVTVARSRVEAFRPGHGFDTITSRAFAELPRMVALSEPLLAPGGCWLAMKGRRPEDELARLPAGLRAEVWPLDVPGEAAARHLIRLERE